MAKTWKEIRKNLAPEREARIAAKVGADLARMPLSEIRRARALTQTRMAELLRIDQGAVSKMEQRSDMYLSTLRSYVEAMGGRLDLRAVFPSGEIMLDFIGDKAPMIQERPPSGRRKNRAKSTKATVAYTAAR